LPEIYHVNPLPLLESEPQHRRPNLFIQVAGTMVMVVLLALGLTTLLNALRFQETFDQLVVRRLDVLVQEVVSDLMVGIDLGLGLEAMDNLGALVSRQSNRADGIAVVRIHDCQGRTLAMAGADDPHVRQRLEIPQLLKPQDRNWHRFEADHIAVGTVLVNSYGQCAGGVVVEYEGDTYQKIRASVIQHQIKMAMVAALMLLPAIAILGWFFYRRHVLLKALRQDLDAITLPNTVPGPEPKQLAVVTDEALFVAYRVARPVLIDESGNSCGAVVPAGDGLSANAGWTHAVRLWLASPVAQVLILTTVTLLLALIFVSSTTADTLKRTLLPELARKGMAQGQQVGRSVQRALDLQIPIEHLVGVDALFDELQRGDDDVAFIAIAGTNDTLLHAAGMPMDALSKVLATPNDARAGFLPAAQSRRAGYLVSTLGLHDMQGRQLGELHFGLRESSLIRPVQDNMADLLIVLLVSLFLSFELMLLVVTVNVTLPVKATLRVLNDVAERRFALIHSEYAMDELGRIARKLNDRVKQAAQRCGVIPVAIREPRLIGVRLLAFLFVCAEELARPIMPAFFGQLASATQGAGAHFGAGGVMALHMAVVAISMPVGSMLYARIGRRRMYALGAVLASVGLMGTSLAGGIGALLFWRAISGIGYAMTFVACQGFVIESTAADNRARGSAMMVGGIMLADICGPAIGGILASWIGHASTFMLGAAVAALAALLVPVLMDQHSDHVDQPPRINVQTFILTLRNRRLVAVLLLAAVPAKVILGGLLYFLTPLALLGLGANEAQTGRTLMLYGLVALLTGPLFASLTDRFQKPVLALTIGGLISALGVVPMYFFDSNVGMALGVLAIGLAQSLSIPALVAAVLDLSRQAIVIHGQGPVMAVLRLLERLGGAAGPLVAAALANFYGVKVAMGIFGLYVLASTVLLLVVMRLTDRRRHRRPPASGIPALDELP
jgi:predicted MFS family arabinose efflux permease